MSKLAQPGHDHAHEEAHAQDNAQAQAASSDRPSPSSSTPTSTPLLTAQPKSVQAIKESSQHHGQLKPLPLNAHCPGHLRHPQHGHHHQPVGKDGLHHIDAAPAPHHARHPRPHQIKGLARRQDCPARCRLQAGHRHGRPARARQILHHQEDGPLSELAAA
ncbi:predicted protein [Plenodomus lingam JN3]|uniref:Predicted protein n=1 Tax=Leptosphaeria maculans (strain JN3 / isolate v23.1.3 / race Av1-4-5-6-7-8) TaxID=985895 RepID=E4ZQD3_LEPMJ|nr:predicted protein [Plenodomus lingam JN3]CBX93608.1 predicted protein [Plenodomus lingam JN3]